MAKLEKHELLCVRLRVTGERGAAGEDGVWPEADPVLRWPGVTAAALGDHEHRVLGPEPGHGGGRDQGGDGLHPGAPLLLSPEIESQTATWVQPGQTDLARIATVI